MSNAKRRLMAAGSACLLVVTAAGISVLGGGTAGAGVTGQTATTATYPLLRNSVSESQVVNYSLGEGDLQQAFVAKMLAVPANGVDTSAKLKDGVVTEADLAPEVATKLNKTGPVYLKHWGTVHRNVIGAADAELATTSTAPPLGDGALNLHTGSAADKVAFGNEVDFAVYTTGENNKLGNNRPSIIFEIDPNVTAVASNYSSLVYAPANGTSNQWTTFNATTDEGKHWGLTSSLFAATPCSIDGARCTWTEMVAYLNDGADDAKLFTATVSKGRDFAFSGAVDALRFGGKTYNFEAAGVTAG